MKLRAWQVNMIKRMLRVFESAPSKEYFETCLKEMAQHTLDIIGSQEKILAFNCFTCGKYNERPYSQGLDARNFKVGIENHLFCNVVCSNVYTFGRLKLASEELDKSYKDKQFIKLMRQNRRI